MIILGLSFGYHDSAATIVVNGKVIAAVQEERFTRIKHDNSFPIHSINFCLQAANVIINDVDEVVFYEKPFKKFLRVIEGHVSNFPFSLKQFSATMPNWLGERLVVPELMKDRIDFDKEILFTPHHISHAASAFYPSGFDKAAIIVSDGIGEDATLSWGTGSENKVVIEEEILFPNSLGLLYSAVSAFLGLGANSGEGKTMGLADWGKPIYKDEFKKFLTLHDDGSFEINQKYLPFGSNTMFSSKFTSLFSHPRKDGDDFSERDKNLAATLQYYTEEILIKVAKRVYEKTGLKNLCLAGGSFLNIPTNSRILNETKFENLFVQPAAGDAGGSMGAALFVSHHIFNEERKEQMRSASLGPDFSDGEIEIALNRAELNYKKLPKEDLFDFISSELSQDKIIGLFQGKMEFGPRALGNRSIIASPRNPQMKDILNSKVKERESFRPYGVSILKDNSKDYFETEHESPFMLALAYGKELAKKEVPAALHVNNTSRLQTVTEEDTYYHSLISAFHRKSGIPMIINTSFNKHEPIVCTPEHAISCFLRTKMDYLVLEDYLVSKN